MENYDYIIARRRTSESRNKIRSGANKFGGVRVASMKSSIKAKYFLTLDTRGTIPVGKEEPAMVHGIQFQLEHET